MGPRRVSANGIWGPSTMVLGLQVPFMGPRSQFQGPRELSGMPCRWHANIFTKKTNIQAWIFLDDIFIRIWPKILTSKSKFIFKLIVIFSVKPLYPQLSAWIFTNLFHHHPLYSFPVSHCCENPCFYHDLRL